MNSQDILSFISAKNFKGIISIKDISLFKIPPVDDYHVYLIKVDDVVFYSVFIFFETAYIFNLSHKFVAVDNLLSDLLSVTFNVVTVENDSIKDLKFLLAGQVYLLNMYEYIWRKSPKDILQCLFNLEWRETLLILKDFYIIRKPSCSHWFM